MDPVTAILVGVGVKVGSHILIDAWNRTFGEGADKGVGVNSQGQQYEFPITPGVASVPSVVSPYQIEEEPPITLIGSFLVENVDWILEDEIVLLLVHDWETEENYFLPFDISEYAINLWPGLYSIYAFILDSESLEMDTLSVLGIGYPSLYEDVDVDPNPIPIDEYGTFSVDILIFDAYDLPG